MTLSPDARFVIGASGGERDAVVWDIGEPRFEDEETVVLKPVAQLPCKGRVGVVECNPRYNMIASAEREVVMWLPDEFVGTKVPGEK